MKAKWVVAVVVPVLVGLVIVLMGGTKSSLPVTVTLRIAISPAEKAAFVARAASSARFKYVVGKQAGIKPHLAQQLSIKPLADSPLLEARIGVLTSAEGNLYADSFVATLQGLCNTQAQVVLAARTIR